MIQMFAKSKQVLSILAVCLNPALSSNYQPELIRSLNIPESTLLVNSEIAARGYSHSSSTCHFID